MKRWRCLMLGTCRSRVCFSVVVVWFICGIIYLGVCWNMVMCVVCGWILGMNWIDDVFVLIIVMCLLVRLCLWF